MKAGLVSGLVCLAAGVVLVLGAAEAQAGWGSYHSSGGSSGSWGGYGSSSSSSSSSSSGYSSSSSSSSGGYGVFRHWRRHRVAWRHHRHHYRSWGSSSSSSGGYYRGWGSSSSSSSSSSTYYSAPYVTPSEPAAPPTPAAEPLPPQARANSGILTVSVPADAVVYVNGKQTTSQGEYRQYVSRGLESGFKYTYEVRVVYQRDGETIDETKSVELRAGGIAGVDFPFHANQQVATTLKLNVPDGAKITLSGVEMKDSEGSLRTFTTHKLAAGESWSGYRVEVSIERDGRREHQNRSITLNAGDEQELTFSFTEAHVAAR